MYYKFAKRTPDTSKLPLVRTSTCTQKLFRVWPSILHKTLHTMLYRKAAVGHRRQSSILPNLCLHVTSEAINSHHKIGRSLGGWTCCWMRLARMVWICVEHVNILIYSIIFVYIIGLIHTIRFVKKTFLNSVNFFNVSKICAHWNVMLCTPCEIKRRGKHVYVWHSTIGDITNHEIVDV